MANSAEPEGPPAARVVVDLLNTRAHAIHPDTLADPSVSAARAALQAAVDGDPAAWAAFDEATTDVTFRMEFGPLEIGTAQARPVPVTGDAVLGSVVLAVSELVAQGLWSRIRVCANEECRKVFYDTTRSRTRRWHSYEVCGNRVNVAAYRARATSG
ncbi:CGNR zinc finger domain-containing protein [Kutzneria sp. CA-103260]|uniref:CGNR zinc finger domain-containing protein n=1 Tax=Kutzneria sp. CA-103260 TaxID=2802641 RepID=UPI001BA9DCDB|nr:CGNR zinc finger domain-containing protein [Kutzneria sp. CA-103260]QUQ64769.1 CGNR zinc finger [Kutzneria sp. CA-103260]